jgi:predicted RNase H-like HicB family nuclease
MSDIKGKYAYPAVFYKYSDGKFAVIFPDIGNATCGDDYDEAVRMAKELLAITLDWMEQDGDTIPEPTPLDKVVPVREEDDDWVEASVHLIEVDLDVDVPPVCVFESHEEFKEAFELEGELESIEVRIAEMKRKVLNKTLTDEEVWEIEAEIKAFRERWERYKKR